MIKEPVYSAEQQNPEEQKLTWKWGEVTSLQSGQNVKYTHTHTHTEVHGQKDIHYTTADGHYL